MTPRLAYALRQSFRLKFGVWLSEPEISAWLEYLASQKVTVQEVGE